MKAAAQTHWILTHSPEARSIEAARVNEHLAEIGYLIDKRRRLLMRADITQGLPWDAAESTERRISAHMHALALRGNLATDAAARALGSSDVDNRVGALCALASLSPDADCLQTAIAGAISEEAEITPALMPWAWPAKERESSDGGGAEAVADTEDVDHPDGQTDASDGPLWLHALRLAPPNDALTTALSRLLQHYAADAVHTPAPAVSVARALGERRETACAPLLSELLTSTMHHAPHCPAAEAAALALAYLGNGDTDIANRQGRGNGNDHGHGSNHGNGHRDARGSVLQATNAQGGDAVRAAPFAFAAALLDVPDLLPALRRQVRLVDGFGRSPYLCAALALLGGVGDEIELERVWQRSRGWPASERAVLQALGALGTSRSAALLSSLIHQLATEPDGKADVVGAARSAYSRITGQVDGPDQSLGNERDGQSLHRANSQGQSPHDRSHSPHAPARTHASPLLPTGGSRCRLGSQFSLASCLQELVSPSTNRQTRQWAAWELHVRGRAELPMDHRRRAVGTSGAGHHVRWPPLLQTCWPVKRQRQVLGQWQAMFESQNGAQRPTRRSVTSRGQP